MMTRLSFAFVLFLTFGCAHKNKLVEPEATPSFKMKAYQEVILPNGLPLILIPDQSLPRVSMGILVMAGSFQDPEGKAGLASFTGSMLENGTQLRSATKMADDLGQIAAELSISVSSDGTLVGTSSINTEKQKLLELFSEAILKPAFDPKEIAREKAQVLSGIERRQDDPSLYADLLMSHETYGQHPYGHPVAGEADSVKTFQQEDLQIFYKKYYAPQNSMLYLAGAYDDAFVEKLKKAFSGWKGEAVAHWTGLPYKLSSAKDIQLFSKADLKQAQIRFAERGICRTDPDYMALKLANLILGGDFVSRLNFRVRDQLGLTYSIHSSLDARVDYGAFDISTFSRDEKVGETISETRKVLQEFVKNGVTASELDAAKALLAGQFPAVLETTEKMANNLVLLHLYGVSDDYIKNFVIDLNAVTLDQVNAAIRNHYHPENFQVVVYADETKVLDQLKTIGNVKVEKVKSLR